FNTAERVRAWDGGRVAPWRVSSRQVTIDPSCGQTITGTHEGAVTAGAGGLCLIVATVDGAVSVEDGGQPIIQDSEVTGRVTTDAASVVSVCGSHVEGRVTVAGTTAGVSARDT